MRVRPNFVDESVRMLGGNPDKEQARGDDTYILLFATESALVTLSSLS